jgi:hypothetical protein
METPRARTGRPRRCSRSSVGRGSVREGHAPHV